MVAMGISAGGQKGLHIVLETVKVNAESFINHILKRIEEKDIPRLYPGEENKVTIHLDSAGSHVCSETILAGSHVCSETILAGSHVCSETILAGSHVCSETILWMESCGVKKFSQAKMDEQQPGFFSNEFGNKVDF
jgi:predicted nucleic acid-binding Zn ribbon protein